jgi:hypothetical protein
MKLLINLLAVASFALPLNIAFAADHDGHGKKGEHAGHDRGDCCDQKDCCKDCDSSSQATTKTASTRAATAKTKQKPKSAARSATTKNAKRPASQVSAKKVTATQKSQLTKRATPDAGAAGAWRPRSVFYPALQRIDTLQYIDICRSTPKPKFAPRSVNVF